MSIPTISGHLEVPMTVNPQTIALTYEQEKLIKKELITLELSHEFSSLSSDFSIRPFLSTQTSQHTLKQYPFLSLIFHRFVRTFPFTARTNNEAEFWEKVELFMQETAKRRFSSSAERAEATKRRELMRRMKSLVVLMFNSALRTTTPRPSDAELERRRSEAGLDRRRSSVGLDLAASLGQLSLNGPGSRRGSRASISEPQYEIDVVSIRKVSNGWVKVGGAGYDTHYLISTKFNAAEVVVGRRYAEAKQLIRDLKLHHPGVDIPPLPNRPKHSNHEQPLPHERARHILRHYLRTLVTLVTPSSSPIFNHFLFQNPTSLTATEIADAGERNILDAAREGQRKKFEEEADATARELQVRLREVKADLLASGGLMRLFEALKGAESLEELPVEYQKAVEWGKLNFAWSLYSSFVGDDKAPANLAELKRTHEMLPYRAMKMILRYTNPIRIMKAMMDLFMAQPLGSKSLMQRIITANMNEEISMYVKDIEECEAQIKEEGLKVKIRNYVYLSQNRRKGDDEDEEETNHVSLVKSVLLDPSVEPIIDAKTVEAVLEDEKVVHLLWKLLLQYSRKQDKEEMINLVFEGVTGALLRDIMTIFYTPLSQVYAAANIGDLVGDVKLFLDDLIGVVEGKGSKDVAPTAAPTTTYQTFTSLVDRHAQNLYRFTHRVYQYSAPPTTAATPVVNENLSAAEVTLAKITSSPNLFHALILYFQSILSFLNSSLPHVNLYTFLDRNLPTENREAVLQLLYDDLHELEERQADRRERRRLRVLERVAMGKGGKEAGVGGLFGGMVDGDDLGDVNEEEDDEESTPGSGFDGIVGGSVGGRRGSFVGGKLSRRDKPLVVLPGLVDAFVEHVTSMW